MINLYAAKGDTLNATLLLDGMEYELKECDNTKLMSNVLQVLFMRLQNVKTKMLT